MSSLLIEGCEAVATMDEHGTEIAGGSILVRDGAIAWVGAGRPPEAELPGEAIREFGERVAAAARPIDDVRGSASYRRLGCEVLARRALSWALEDRRLPLGVAG